MVNDCKSSSDSYCKYCQRCGQFLPVRISIGLKDESIDILKPKPSIVKDLPKLPNGYEYILRRLNEGYIYTFSENWRFSQRQEDKLNLYKVNENGYIKELDKGEMDVDVKPDKCLEFSATENEIKTSAGESLSGVFLLDLYPVEGNDVSIVYTRHRLSDQAYKNLSDDATIRNKIMQKFDIQGSGVYEFLMDKRLSTKVLDNLQVSQNDLMASFEKIVPWDYVNIIKNEKKVPFSVSKFLIDDENGNPNYTYIDFGDVNKKPEKHIVTGDSIIVLDDPIGIMEDLIKIINKNNNKITIKLNEIEYQTFNNIKNLKSIEYSKYFNEKIKKRHSVKVKELAKKDSKDYTSDDYKLEKASKQYVTEKSGFILTDMFNQKELKNINDETEAEFKEKWSKYNKCYNEERMNLEIDSINDKVRMEMESVLKPLFLLYIDYFKSNVLLNYFSCLFDHKSISSASEFLGILTSIIQNMDGYSLVSDFFVSLLGEDDFNNPNNYLMRAFIFDNPSVADAVNSLDEFLKDYKISDGYGYLVEKWGERNSGLSTDIFFSFIKYSQNQLREQSLLFSEVIGGSLIRSVNNNSNGHDSNLLRSKMMVSFELFSGKQFSVSDYTGNYKKILKTIVNDFSIKYSDELSRSQKKLAKINVENSVNAILNNQFGSKLSANTSTKYNLTVIVDSELKLEFDHSNFDRNVMLEGKFNTKEYFLSNGEQIFIDSRKTVFEKSLTNAKYYNNTLRGFNVLGLGFNAIGIMNFIGMVEKKGVFDGKMIAELVGNIMSLIGGIADVFILEKTSKVLSLHRLNSISMVSAELNIARAGLTKLNSNLWKITFSVLIVNIVVNAFIGYIQFKKNIRNNIVLAVSYGVTAVISIASAVLFFLGAIVWGMALVLLAFVVDFYIKHLESVKIQDYLKNCRWGIHNKNWDIFNERSKYIYATS